MDDLISRQAAIDAVAEGLKRTFVEYRDTAEKMLNMNKVPSVEPEIIRCKDCVHHGYEGHIPYCDIKDYGYGWKDDDFRSDAERSAE